MKLRFLLLTLPLLVHCFLYGNQNPMRFPSFSEKIPYGYTGTIFSLSQDYPLKLPNSERPWEKFDFRTQPEEYLSTILEYIHAGMEEVDWRAELNIKREWYHMPWMHVGKHPRECLRGMTRERDSSVCELGPLQSCRIQNWGLSIYNDYAAYTLGRVWSQKNPIPEAASFPHGAMLVKLLFTEATSLELPYLVESMVWQGYINSTIEIDSPKAIRKLRLLQCDVIVRDPRADELTGWVFATYVYDCNTKGKLPWNRMTPVGLCWGNDPEITLEDIANGSSLVETYISPLVPQQGKERLGWGGRLNGLVDNNQSSCMSCHSTAQWEPISPMVPMGTLQEKQRWFRNLAADEPFDAGQQSLGNSLQLMIALQNYFSNN